MLFALIAALQIQHYALRVELDPAKHTLSGEATITVRNAGEQPVAAVPLLLYRLMDVTAAFDAAGKPLAVTQKVVKFPDEPAWQVNAIEATLPSPLPPGGATTIRVRYGGALFGYPEVMGYVRETISEEYSLLRAESMPYPIVAPPTYKGWSSWYDNNVDATIETVVPPGFVALTSGKGSIDIAVAKFKTFEDAQRHLHVYAMPADAEAGGKILSEMVRALDFYTSYLGPSPHASALTLIEIPNGWGSYATNGRIFQAAAAFKDTKRANELYHEVSHFWTTVKPERSIQRARYFDEAFATYFEALAVRQFEGEEAFRKEMERTRNSFRERVAKDERGRTTPIAEYGKYELGGFAYSKGAWSLYALNQLLGDDLFRRSVAKFLADYSDKPADFNDLLHSLEATSGRDLHPWFQEWILSGAESSARLLE